MPNGDGGSPDGGAAGGSGLAAGQSLADEIKSTADDIVKIVNDIQNLDDVTSRSVVGEIDNVCGHTLNFESNHFDHGGFGPDLPAASINDKKSALFNAQSSGFLVGVEGFVTYDLDDGAGSRFTIHFDNPEVGSNSGDCSVEGAVSNRYFTKAITGSGNHGAHMRYIIGQLNGPFSLRAFLTNTMPSGFDPNAPFTSIRNLQPPVTSISSFMKV